ncbi:MAG TPA: LCP family protein [Thermoleophilaceae bacterium]|nr:LCP family protein [Thermoleophilaceae bacterium]
MTNPPPRPEYKVYRSRRGPFVRLRGLGGLEGLRRSRGRDPGPRLPRERPPWRKVLKWVAIVAAAWIALAIVLFFVSAQLEQNKGVPRSAQRRLQGHSSFLTGSTVLVIGSDRRPSTSTEEKSPPRADSMMLLRASLGQVRRVSILRDSYAEIPGYGAQKINSAYAIGGTGLLIRTVEGFFGGDVQVNHVIRLSFDGFPKLIDALGGIRITLKRCVRSQKFNGRRVNLSKGTHHLDGQEALRFARVRQNFCDPSEDDRDRAARQQMVLSAIRSRLFSPGAFVRAPWIGWRVPQTISTDLAGPGLSALAFDVVTGGSGRTRVLEPAGFGPGGSVLVSEEERAAAVRYLRGGR